MLHAPGNSFVRDLGHGERILVQPNGLIWKDPSVQMYLHFEYPRVDRQELRRDDSVLVTDACRPARRPEYARSASDSPLT